MNGESLLHLLWERTDGSVVGVDFMMHKGYDVRALRSYSVFLPWSHLVGGTQK